MMVYFPISVFALSDCQLPLLKHKLILIHQARCVPRATKILKAFQLEVKPANKRCMHTFSISNTLPDKCCNQNLLDCFGYHYS